ncbi:MAG TPA: hypothetical protein VNI01_07520, partial [Elusimicrobiota bacterium]|nr:hypothetical protein [Elusimicrobiota bacterium]
MFSRLRASLASVLSAALIALAPGPEAWAAVARSSSHGPASAPGVVPALSLPETAGALGGASLDPAALNAPAPAGLEAAPSSAPLLPETAVSAEAIA